MLIENTIIRSHRLIVVKGTKACLVRHNPPLARTLVSTLETSAASPGPQGQRLAV